MLESQSPEFSRLESCHLDSRVPESRQAESKKAKDFKTWENASARACPRALGYVASCVVGYVLRFCAFAGEKAIYFYIAQGVSSSLLFPILRHFPEILQIHWSIKLACAFGVNLALCVGLVFGLMGVFGGIGIIGGAVKRGLEKGK